MWVELNENERSEWERDGCMCIVYSHFILQTYICVCTVNIILHTLPVPIVKNFYLGLEMLDFLFVKLKKSCDLDIPNTARRAPDLPSGFIFQLPLVSCIHQGRREPCLCIGLGNIPR